MQRDDAATLAQRELAAISNRTQDRLYHLGRLELALGDASLPERARLSVECLDLVRDVLAAQLHLVRVVEQSVGRLMSKPE